MADSRIARGVAMRLHLDVILRPAYRWWTNSLPRVVKVRPLGLSCKMRLDPRELRDYELDVEHEERDFLDALNAHLHPGETALDVGAHLGEFTLPLAKMVGDRGHVLAFEPEVGACRRLEDHVKLNGLTNVHVFRKALGEEDGAGRIFLEGGACPTIVPLADDTVGRSVSENIEVARGDTFFARERLPVPHAAKIDVEGFEYAVLRGLCGTLANPICRLICVEIHPELLAPGVSAGTITDLLQSLGFSQFRTEPRGTEVHVVAVKPAHTS
jgi:FkbM family methyltransferase